MCGPEEPTTDWCWRSIENVVAKKRAEVSRLRGVESVMSQWGKFEFNVSYNISDF